MASKSFRLLCCSFKDDMNPTASVTTTQSFSNTYASELGSREPVQQLPEAYTTNEAYDTPWLLPKHKIFISHSGMQKDFAEQLCQDLETHGYFPFFDKRPDSLPKGEMFPPLIFKAARECLLAIVLISKDFFTRTKWPMLELAAFVQSQKTRNDLRILPVLLDLTKENLENAARWSDVWIKWQKGDQRLTHNVISEWADAVQALRAWTMILKSSYDGEVKLREAIVRFIYDMMPPDIRSSVLNVQGREHLCKEVLLKFDTISPTSRLYENATVLGVFGIGGAGKSTLCMIVTEHVRSEFSGRVCVVELGKEISTVNLQRQVLRQLCRDSEAYLKDIRTENEALNRLEERISRERVFLAIDNVSDDEASRKAAMSFLGLKFHPESRVLVTSRSEYVLCSLLGIPEGSCMPCPSITKEEALQILHGQVNLPLEVLDEEQVQVLQHAVDLSFFEGTNYHPLALQLFAAQLGTDQSKWRDTKLDLEWTSDVEHPLFSKIETNFTRLPDQDTQDIFMDIALFTPQWLRGINDIIWWLTNTLRLDVNRITQKLETLKVKSLLERWKMEDESFRIHDLYRMFAERNSNVDCRYIYQRGGIAPPRVVDYEPTTVERAAFVEGKGGKLELSACTNLRVLSVRRGKELKILSIPANLVSLEVAECALRGLSLSGLRNLRWLHVSSCDYLGDLHVSGLLTLQHVSVSFCGLLQDLNFEKCRMMRSVSISYSGSLHFVNLGSVTVLESLALYYCETLEHVAMRGDAYLTTLKKEGCPRLLRISGGGIMSADIKNIILHKWGIRLSPTFIRDLEISESLQVLDIAQSSMSRLPDMRTCLNLQELRLNEVHFIQESKIEEYERIKSCTSAADLELPISLESVRSEGCSNEVVQEMLWKVQGLRNLRVLSLQNVVCVGRQWKFSDWIWKML